MGSVLDNVVVIDEPELSLHPSLQRRMAGAIERISKNRLIIVAMNSPYFVDINSLVNGRHLARITTTDECIKSISIRYGQFSWNKI